MAADTETPSARKPRGPRLTPRAGALALVAMVLVGTAQERALGVISDEQQLLGTATALACFGEVGLPRGLAFGRARDAGDVVSPYGLLWPLMLAPVVPVARAVDLRIGAGASQSVLACLPLALVLAAAALAGSLARSLGASPRGEALAILATGIASPLWPLGSTLFTEPLQSVLLGGTCLLAIRATASTPRENALALAAGSLAGALVLAKSFNLAVAPFALLPLVLAPGARWRRVGWSALGASLPLVAWLALEIARFGRPLSSYAGQHFSHPVVDGTWRLLVGANKGLLVYFPPAILGAWALWRAMRVRETRASAAGALLPALVMLPLVGAWWAWDGSAGWGPRLLAPVIPLLAAGFGVAASSPALRLPAAALLALGFAANLPGVLLPEPAGGFYVDATGSSLVPEDEVDQFPDGLAASAPPGQRRVSRSMMAVRDAAFAPMRIHAYVVAAKMARLSRDERLDVLADAPWRGRHPELEPHLSGVPGQISGVLLDCLLADFRWPHLGAALREDPARRRAGFIAAHADALTDQVMRMLDLGRRDDALRSSALLLRVRPDPLSAALHAEALRAAGRRDVFEALKRSLTPVAIGLPEMQVVLALDARDRGDEASAREHLRKAQEVLAAPAVGRALEQPMSDWPAGLRELTNP